MKTIIIFLCLSWPIVLLGQEREAFVVADSILETKHINDVDSIFTTNIVALYRYTKGISGEKIVVHNPVLKEFIWVYDKMSQQGIVNNPHVISISMDDVLSMQEWYKKNKERITISDLRAFYRVPYLFLLNDQELDCYNAELDKIRDGFEIKEELKTPNHVIEKVFPKKEKENEND